MLRTLWLILLTLSIVPTVGFARDVYVNNQVGDDRATGRNPQPRFGGEGPVSSLGRALAIANRGDRIVMADTGTPYRESVTLQAGRNSGEPDRPFVIEGNGATLDGSEPVPPDAWEFWRGEVFRFQPRRFSHQQLFLNDRPLARRTPDANGGLPDLQPLEWCYIGRHIYFRPEPDRLPGGYELTHASLPVGIGFYEVHDVVVNGLTIQGFQLDGVNAHDSAFQIVLDNLVCRGNGRAGISVGGASRVTIRDCLVGNNGAAQVRTEGYSRTRIIDSNLLDNTAPPLVRDGGSVNIVPPTDPANGGSP